MIKPLLPCDRLPTRSGPVVLCILDGVGLGLGEEDDAVAQAHTPHLDTLMADCPFLSLKAHGVAVGLASDKDMGNSEVGHNAMGAGRVFDQGAKLVEQAINAGDCFEGEVWARLISAPTLHLLGLVSDGNVHSHVDHLIALIERATADGVQHVRVHILTDGRDVEQRSALRWVLPLEDRCRAHRESGRDVRIASGGGRMHITMDRYGADWEMVQRGWLCHVHGEGERFASASQAIQTLYERDPWVDDQSLPAFVVVDEQGPVGPIEDGDSVLFFNFRGDRAIEISRAFEEDDFSGFERPHRPHVFFAGMMQYDGDLAVPAHYLVEPPAISQTVGEYLAANGKRTFACSETQKFGHVTFFFNGNRSGHFDTSLEHYEEVPSIKTSFSDSPEMSAEGVTRAAQDALREGGWDHIRLNYANGDMVGHTGDLQATRKAVEIVDVQLGLLCEAVAAAQGVMIITADHGNADEMWMRKNGAVAYSPDGQPVARTAHTLNPVPCVLFDPAQELRFKEIAGAGIASLGATVLELCGLTPPENYEPSLLL